nr:MAG: ORF1 [Torque teno midi virus]
MPFWWRRRKRNWYGRYQRKRFNKRRRPYYRRRRRRRFTTRRRRRRKTRRKVRRKRKTIAIRQWQPESIIKCKIIGYSTLILGAQGRQFYCWTNEAKNYIQPKAPGGGGFGYEVITLEWLYDEWVARQNVWTGSNQFKDLLRYTGCTIWLHRHPTRDFIFCYDLQPPFDITKHTYYNTHPYMLLLKKHKKVVLSQQSKPNGKLFVKVKIRPPKQMTTKWFFQQQFYKFGLVNLQASVATLRYPRISCQAQSQMITIYYLNPDFFTTPDWGQTINGQWLPLKTITLPITFYYKDKQGKEQTFTINRGQIGQESEYYKSINRDGGWFDPRVLNAYKIKQGSNTEIAQRPIWTARYNPNEDNGVGNKVYVISVLGHSYLPPTTQHNWVISDQPIWLALWGFWNYLQYETQDQYWYKHMMFVIKCPAIKPITQAGKTDWYAFVDLSFVSGNMPYEEYLDENAKKLWYPTAMKQTETINAIVESGPFVPKLGNLKESTWELYYKYKFFFKWGGPQIQEKPIDDPQHQGFYPIPDNFQQGLQISHPKHLSPQSILHQWDFRRGFVTETALKRMQEHLQTDTDVQSSYSEPEKKKRKIQKEVPHTQEKQEALQACLRSLFEEDTFQDTDNLKQLIIQQQQQQQQLKSNILVLLSDLKQQQRYLGLQTGNLV